MTQNTKQKMVNKTISHKKAAADFYGGDTSSDAGLLNTIDNMAGMYNIIRQITMNVNNFKAGVPLDLPFQSNIDGRYLWLPVIIKMPTCCCIFDSIKLLRVSIFFVLTRL